MLIIRNKVPFEVVVAAWGGALPSCIVWILSRPQSSGVSVTARRTSSRRSFVLARARAHPSPLNTASITDSHDRLAVKQPRVGIIFNDWITVFR